MSRRSVQRLCRCAALAWGCAVLVVFLPAVRAWTPVGTGIEYQEFTLPDPNNLFVARMDRHNPQVIIDTSIGQGRLSGGTETIRNQASRYDDALSFWGHDWGQRNDVIVAVNGDFWNTSTGVPTNGQVHTGWYARWIDPSYHFFYGMDRQARITQASTALIRVTWLGTGANQAITDMNRARGTDELILYTPQYDAATPAGSTGVEVLVELTRPNLPVPPSDPIRGQIRQIRQNQGSTPIPFDHVVLSASGTRATTVLANAAVGEAVNITNYLDGYYDVDRTFAAIGGGEVFLGQGVVWGGQAVRHPRTAVAYNDDYVFFVVCDGRSAVSVGMTMTELGNFCKNYLDATWGMNLDGGGSSTMVVNGVTRNDPSDGTDRAVANGLMMVVPQPKLQATTYNSGATVRTSGSSNVRLGPGTNYAVQTTLNPNIQGVILDHSLRGIYAKGYYWWKCDFGTATGWVAHSNLTAVSAGNRAVISSHPTNRYVCPGAVTTLSVSASGSGTLTYRWQRSGIDLSDGGHVSGAATPTLTISGTDRTDEASYRCIVTDSNGPVTSYSAGLWLREVTQFTQQPQPVTIHPVTGNVSASFTVSALGDGAISYQWQRDQQNLSDDSHYAGSTGPTLQISNIDSTVRGTYRCVVTAGCGAVISNESALTVISADLDGDGDSDQSDFAKLQLCISAVQLPETRPECLIADMDNDDHVDAIDLIEFFRCVAGSNLPMPPGC